MGKGRQHPAFGNNSDYLPALGDRKVVLMSEQHTSHFIRSGMCRQNDERRTILYGFHGRCRGFVFFGARRRRTRSLAYGKYCGQTSEHQTAGGKGREYEKGRIDRRRQNGGGR